MADGGSDAEANHRWVWEERRMASKIAAMTGRSGQIRQPYRRQRQLTFPHRESGWRWKAETVISAVKGPVGSLARPIAMCRQLNRSCFGG